FHSSFLLPLFFTFFHYSFFSSFLLPLFLHSFFLLSLFLPSSFLLPLFFPSFTLLSFLLSFFHSSFFSSAFLDFCISCTGISQVTSYKSQVFYCQMHRMTQGQTGH